METNETTEKKEVVDRSHLEGSLDDILKKEGIEKKKKFYKKVEVPGDIRIFWIDDSSCVIKFP